MTTNPQATRILCFGDSNTWGQRPDRRGRFAVDKRWTGLLQQQLGDDFEIIEEGLTSRTTDLNYANKPGRNGKTYFLPCLQSHYPLDMVVIMLGTNDLKLEYGPRPANQIADAVGGLVNDVRKYAIYENLTPKVVVASPIHIKTSAPRFSQFYAGYYDEQSADIASGLATSLQSTATKEGAIFIDAAAYAGPGEDGIHMDESGHAAFASALSDVIKEHTA